MENRKISNQIVTLGTLKAFYDCAVAGKSLYGFPLSESERRKALDDTGRNIESATDRLEALCLKEGFDVKVAMLRVHIATQEDIRRSRTPDASDRGPTFL